MKKNLLYNMGLFDSFLKKKETKTEEDLNFNLEQPQPALTPEQPRVSPSQFSNSFQMYPSRNQSTNFNQSFGIDFQNVQTHTQPFQMSSTFQDQQQTQNQYEYQYTQSYTSQDFDWDSYIQAIAEKVVEEKIQILDQKINDLNLAKERLSFEIEQIKEDVKKLSDKVDNLYNTLIKKIEEYDKGIKEATVEVQALHKLVRTMIPAISESVKELKETIEEIKLLRDSIRRP